MEDPNRGEVVREERVVEPAAPVRQVAEVAPVAAVAPVRHMATYNYRAVQVTWFVVGLIDILIAIRFIEKLLSASPSSAFVGFTYGVTAPLVAPFTGIFPTSAQGSFIFEPASLVAIAVYALLGWGIATLIRIVTTPRGTRALS